MKKNLEVIRTVGRRNPRNYPAPRNASQRAAAVVKKQDRGDCHQYRGRTEKITRKERTGEDDGKRGSGRTGAQRGGDSSDFGRIPCLTKSDLIKWACKFIEVREEG